MFGQIEDTCALLNERAITSNIYLDDYLPSTKLWERWGAPSRHSTITSPGLGSATREFRTYTFQYDQTSQGAFGWGGKALLIDKNE